MNNSSGPADPIYVLTIGWNDTFKIWNTPLALETCHGFPISKDEFVTFDSPKWEIYQKIKMDDLIMQYLKKDSLD